MATAAESARDEVKASLDAMALEHEGLRDLRKLVTNEQAAREVDAAIAFYDRRRDILEATYQHLVALITHGHPALDVREVVDAAYRDIKNQNDSVAAALLKFRSDVATELKVTTGTPVPKDDVTVSSTVKVQ